MGFQSQEHRKLISGISTNNSLHPLRGMVGSKGWNCSWVIVSALGWEPSLDPDLKGRVTSITQIRWTSAVYFASYLAKFADPSRYPFSKYFGDLSRLYSWSFCPLILISWFQDVLSCIFHICPIPSPLGSHILWLCVVLHLSAQNQSHPQVDRWYLHCILRLSFSLVSVKQ